MDAIKILGDLLSNNHVARGQGRNILQQVVGGAGANGRRPDHSQRTHAPAHRHGHSQSSNGVLGGLIRAAVEQYGQQGQSHQAQHQQADHHRQQHDHEHQRADHLRQQQELRELELKRQQLEHEAAIIRQQHQREEQRHSHQETRHHQAEQRHTHGRQPSGSHGRFPDNREAANFQAQLLIRAMIYAAKADGCLDQQEQKAILGRMGHLSVQEKQFLQYEFSRNINTCDFAREIPAGLEDEVYAISLASIDLDTNQEARYLHELSRELELSHQVVNYIHQQVGDRPLFN